MVMNANILKSNGIQIDGPENLTNLQYLSKRASIIETPIQFRPGKYDISFIGAYTYLGGGNNTILKNVRSIGRFCSIASNVNCGQVEHPTNFLSTHPMFYGQWKHAWPETKDFYSSCEPSVRKCEELFEKFRLKKQGDIYIGSDVWIGEGVYIAPGVVVGDGAVIATRSVVTKDVEPYSIVGGVPAKIIKYRFSPEIISKLLELKWWLYDISILNRVDFTDIECAISQLEDNINKNDYKLMQPKTILVDDNGDVIENVESDSNLELLYLSHPSKKKVTYNSGIEFEFDLTNSHERKYFLNFLGECHNPDEFIASIFVQDGDFVLDIGANIGFTTYLYRKYGAKNVYAYEPVPYIFNRLINHCSKDYSVRAFNFALSNKNGKADIYLSKSHDQGSTIIDKTVDLFPSVFGDSYHIEKITTRTLDSLNLGNRKIDFIKLDVEGAELSVLQGAINTIKNNKPRAIQLECYDNDLNDILDILEPIYKYVYRLDDSNEGFNLVNRSKFCDVKLLPPIYVFTDIFNGD